MIMSTSFVWGDFVLLSMLAGFAIAVVTCLDQRLF